MKNSKWIQMKKITAMVAIITFDITQHMPVSAYAQVPPHRTDRGMQIPMISLDEANRRAPKELPEVDLLKRLPGFADKGALSPVDGELAPESAPISEPEIIPSEQPTPPARGQAPPAPGEEPPADSIEVFEGESIQKAINEAQAGDTVYVHAGTYHGPIVLPDGVNLIGEDRDLVTIHGDYTERVNVIVAQGGNVIEGLTITGSGPYNGGNSSAIRVEGDGVIIRANHVTDNLGYGIYLRSGQDATIERNLFTDNKLAIQHPHVAVTGTVIRYNTMADNNTAINLLGGSVVDIHHNIITGSRSSAIYEFSWTGHVSGSGITGYANVHDNTFYDNNWKASAYGSSTPPAVENLTTGNAKEDPGYLDPESGDYYVTEHSPSFGRGAYAPITLVADPTLTPADISRLSGFLNLIPIQSQESTANILQHGPTDYTLDYSLAKNGEWALAYAAFDDFTTLPEETGDLSALDQLVFSLSLGIGKGDVLFEIESLDASGQVIKETIILEGVSMAEQFYGIPTELLQRTNLSRVKGIGLAVKPENVSYWNGELHVKFGDFPYTPVIDPFPWPAHATTLPGVTGLLSLDGGNFGDPRLAFHTQQSSSLSTLHYDVQNRSWAQLLSTFDDFGTLPIETADLSGLPNIIVGLQLASGSGVIKMQFEDSHGQRAVLELTGVDTTEHFYFVNLFEINDLVDLSSLANVNFVVEEHSVSSRVGELHVRLGGHPYTPITDPNPILGPADVTVLDGIEYLAAITDPVGDSQAIINQHSSSHYGLYYAVSERYPWAMALSSFGGGQDLSGLQEIVVGLALSSGAGTIKMQLEDRHGMRSVIHLTGVDTTEHFYSIDMSQLEGVDLTAIANVNFVVEYNQVTNPTGELSVRLGGHPFTQSIFPEPFGVVTSLPFSHSYAFKGPFGGNPVSFMQHSLTSFSMVYDGVDVGNYAGLSFNFDEPFDFNAHGPVTIALRGNSFIGNLEFNIQDINGNQATAQLIEVDGAQAFYTIDPSVFGGLDLSQIVTMTVVAKGENIISPSGAFDLEFGTVPYVPVLNPRSNLTEDDVTPVRVTNDTSLYVTTSSANVQVGAPATTMTYAFVYDPAVPEYLFAGYTFENEQDLSALTELVIGVQGDFSDITMSIEDVDGGKSEVSISGISKTEEGYYRLPLDQLIEVDFTKVKGIYFFPPLATSGDLIVTMPVLHPEVVHDPTLTPADLEGLPSEGFSGIAGGRVTERGVHGSLVGAGDFFALGFGIQRVVDLSGKPEILIGLKGDVSDFEIRFEDTNWNHYSFQVIGVSATEERIFRIPLGDVTGIDLTQIRAILAVANGQVGELDINHSPSLPEVPEGWTRAASNVNYAFREEVVFINFHEHIRLTMMDLRTTVETILSTNIGGLGTVFAPYDVAPDESVVVFSTEHLSYPAEGRIVIQSIANPDQSLVLSGNLRSVGFEEGGRIAVFSILMLTGHANPTTETREIRIDTSTLQIVVPEGWTRAANASDYAYREVDGVVEVLELESGNITDEPYAHDLNIFQTWINGLRYVVVGGELKEVYMIHSKGNNSIRVYDPGVGIEEHLAGYSLGSSLQAYDVTEDGQFLLGGHTMNVLSSMSLSAQGPTHRHNFPFDPEGNGIPTIESIENTGGNAFRVMVDDSGAPVTIEYKREFQVIVAADGSLTVTLVKRYVDGAEVPIVPEGWTRAASNPNYAFANVCEDVSCDFQNFFVKDLQGGDETLLLRYPAEEVLIRDRDVDAQGNVVFVSYTSLVSASILVQNLNTGVTHTSAISANYSAFELLESGLVKITEWDSSVKYFDPTTGQWIEL